MTSSSSSVVLGFMGSNSPGRRGTGWIMKNMRSPKAPKMTRDLTAKTAKSLNSEHFTSFSFCDLSSVKVLRPDDIFSLIIDVTCCFWNDFFCCVSCSFLSGSALRFERRCALFKNKRVREKRECVAK